MTVTTSSIRWWLRWKLNIEFGVSKMNFRNMRRHVSLYKKRQITCGIIHGFDFWLTKIGFPLLLLTMEKTNPSRVFERVVDAMSVFYFILQTLV